MTYSAVLISAVQQSESLIHIPFSLRLFPHRPLQSAEQSSLRYAVGPARTSFSSQGLPERHAFWKVRTVNQHVCTSDPESGFRALTPGANVLQHSWPVPCIFLKRRGLHLPCSFIPAPCAAPRNPGCFSAPPCPVPPSVALGPLCSQWATWGSHLLVSLSFLASGSLTELS